MNSIETGGSGSDQPAMPDRPDSGDNSPMAEDASNRGARGWLGSGNEVSGNIESKSIGGGSDPLKEEFEKWQHKLGIAMK